LTAADRQEDEDWPRSGTTRSPGAGTGERSHRSSPPGVLLLGPETRRARRQTTAGALVASPDVRNRLANDVIVVPVSSVIRDAPTHVHLRAREGGLPPSQSASRSPPSVAIASPPRRSGEPCLPRAWSMSRRRFFGRSAYRCR